MKTLDFTGINEVSAKAICEELGVLLANYQVLYTNVRGFHWNIEGGDFFTLHPEFESQYTSISAKVDELAERILQLGGKPANNYSVYLKVSSVKEVADVCCGDTAVRSILDGLAVVMSKQRAILKLAADKGDDVTADLMTGYLGEQEKKVWMYTAFLRKGACKEDGACKC